MMNLEGKVAIVTGASRGTGAAITRRFVECGAHVFFGDVRHPEGEALAEELGQDATYVPHDVTNTKEWSAIVARASEKTGRVDILVNNAAVLHLGTLENTDADVLRNVLEVNTVGPYLGIRAVLSTMRGQGGGSIVNVGSLDSLVGMNGITSYCTSKWALRGLAKAAALELGRAGIRINTVCPAGGNPEMYGPWFPKLMNFMEESQAYIENRAIPSEAPLERIADAVCFFASDASLHCTGVDLPVDGGAYAGNFIPGFNTL